MTHTTRPSKIVPRPGSGEPTGRRDPVQYRSRDWMAAVARIEYCVLCGTHGVQVAHRNEGEASIHTIRTVFDATFDALMEVKRSNAELCGGPSGPSERAPG